MTVLQKPLITEKASKNNDKGVYCFLANQHAKKIVIKKEIESLYNVKVISINTMIYPIKRMQRYTKKGIVNSKKSGYKKAIVTLKQGDVIDFYN